MIEGLVNIRGGNPGGRSKYFLNDSATIKKLKNAANNTKHLDVVHKQGSIKMNMSTGAYIITALPLLKFWETCIGRRIIPSDVDDMDVGIDKIFQTEDAKGTIEKYQVTMVVEGQSLTVTLFDTTLSLRVQAGSILEEYVSRVLQPYLETEIAKHLKLIDETNAKVKAYDEQKPTIRQKKMELAGRAQNFQEHPTPARLRTLSSPSTLVLALPHSASPPPNQDTSSYPQALLPPGSPVRTPGLLARAVTWLPEVLASPFLPSPRYAPSEEQQQHPSPAPTFQQLETPSFLASLPPNPSILAPPSEAPLIGPPSEDLVDLLEEAGPPPLEEAGPPPEASPQASSPAPTPQDRAPMEKQAPGQEPPQTEPDLGELAQEQETNASPQAEENTLCFPCDKCDAVCISTDNLRNHMQNLHTSNNILNESSEASILTASGRPICLTPNFVYKHMDFMNKMNNDHDDNCSISEESDDEACEDGEICKVCEKKLSNVTSLQDHILSKHRAQPESVLELLRLQQQLLKSLLAGQTSQIQEIKDIALKQTCIVNDIKEMNNASSRTASFPVPPAPQVPQRAPSKATRPQEAPEVHQAAPARAPSYAGVAGGQQNPLPQGRKGRRKHKLLLAGDSLLATHHKHLLKEATKAEVEEVSEVKCYAAVFSKEPEFKFRRQNFRDVVPAELEDGDYTAVLMQMSSVELTNLKGKGASSELLKQTANIAAKNMFAVATTAAINPTVEKVVLAEAPPRIDEMREHAEYGNQVLGQLWEESEPALKDKITIGKHSLTKKCPCRDPNCQQFPGPSGGLEVSRYGSRASHGDRYDGIHFRGTSGKIANTRSIVGMLATAGLATPLARSQGPPVPLMQQPGQSWQEVQGGKRRGGRAPRRLEPFQLALRNRFMGN